MGTAATKKSRFLYSHHPLVVVDVPTTMTTELHSLLARVTMVDDDDRPRKKCRVETTCCGMDVEPLLSEPSPQLPAVAWAQALEYLHFDEALAMSSLNLFFLREVSPLIRQLHVRKESNLQLGPAVRRFPAVTNVRVTCLLEDHTVISIK